MAALLAVVLGMGGHTFAKYIPTASVPAQQANVAQWGYVIQQSSTQVDFKGQKVFNTTYDITNTGVIKSLNTTPVVAPGAEGELSVYIAGQPEVASKISFNATATKEVHLDDYYPIVWTVTHELEGELNETTKTFNRLKGTGGLIEYVNELGDDYAAAPNTKYESTMTISWSWAFYVDDATDVLDTVLGDYAVSSTLPSGYTEAVVSLDFGLTVTVEQTK
jgi:hypothetical protein